MMKINYLFILFLFFSSTLLGQFQEVGTEEDEEFDEISRVQLFEANFSMYRPLDTFKSKIERNMLYGFSMAYLVQLQKEKPSFIGVEIFHMNLGLYSRNYEAIVGNEQLVVTGKVASNALGFNTVYRYYPPLKLNIFEPYLEGQFGVKYLYTYLSEAGSFSDDEPFENFDFLTGDWVLTYAGAFGFQIHISNMYFINVKSSYHFAISGEYQRKLKADLAFIDFPQEAFELVQSSTNMIKIDLGFTILF